MYCVLASFHEMMTIKSLHHNNILLSFITIERMSLLEHWTLTTLHHYTRQSNNYNFLWDNHFRSALEWKRRWPLHVINNYLTTQNRLLLHNQIQIFLGTITEWCADVILCKICFICFISSYYDFLSMTSYFSSIFKMELFFICEHQLHTNTRLLIVDKKISNCHVNFTPKEDDMMTTMTVGFPKMIKRKKAWNCLHHTLPSSD